MCLRRKIALWDVLEQCEITGAEDSSIRSPKPNNLQLILDNADIRAVFTTGKKAHALYAKFFSDLMPDICLPSTSPANRTISEPEIIKQYSQILKYLSL